MAAAISAVLVGAPPPATFNWERNQRRAAAWGGGGCVPVECSSRPKKKGTAHHMKTRPKKSQPWDVKRKGPTLYPSLPLLPPDWTFADDDGPASAQQAAAAEASLGVTPTAVSP